MKNNLLYSSWQDELRHAITDIETLCHFVGIHSKDLSLSPEVCKSFPLRVTQSFAQRIEKNNPNDPLLLQVLPQMLELEDALDFTKDPLNEKKYNPVPGLLHKYHGRVLITLTAGCAINCRYCFRRHFPYAENTPGSSSWNLIYDYLKHHPEIDEVILSGGDPLTLKDETLRAFITPLNDIPHLKRLRIHSRLPIVLPSRIDLGLINVLATTRLSLVLVTHSNHPNELNLEVKDAIQRLKTSLNITLLNHTVLLKNINDKEQILIDLSLKLFEYGIMPYYLFLLDKVKGAAHFDLSEDVARELYSKIKSKLSGYLVPKLAREIPEQHSKSLLF